MENQTVQYKRTLRGSVGAGVGALFNGNGRRYYILTHKDASKYHKAGESQKIIIDEIEIGRGSNCQVRFDETFSTVSRRHAAIVKDGDRWKLVQLSQVNSTFINGKPIEKEWYLENGDEIQLSVGGPRLGFIVPVGKQSLVSSIKITERLELFRKQALKPYKTAIVCLAVAMVLLGCGAMYKIGVLNNILEQQGYTISTLRGKLDITQAQLDSLDSIAQIKPAPIIKPVVINPSNNISKELTKYESDVYFIQTTKVEVTNGAESRELSMNWTGTGFLSSDGRFITAKHCVEGWKFKGIVNEYVRSMYAKAEKDVHQKLNEEKDSIGAITAAVAYKIAIEEELSDLSTGINHSNGYRVVAHFVAKSKSGNMLTFTSDDFEMNRATERKEVFADTHSWVFESDHRSDWAFVRNTGAKGKIVADAALSSSLPIGAELHILGYPLGMGAVDTHVLHPLYGSCKTAQSGLDGGIIRIGARNFESGNSGGPVFYYVGGVLKAVGVVSYSVGDSSQGGIVPLSNLK